MATVEILYHSTWRYSSVSMATVEVLWWLRGNHGDTLASIVAPEQPWRFFGGSWRYFVFSMANLEILWLLYGKLCRYRGCSIATMETLWGLHDNRGDTLVAPWQPWRSFGIWMVTMVIIEIFWLHHSNHEDTLVAPWQQWRYFGGSMVTVEILWWLTGNRGGLLP